jgi:hypothetical protein
MGHRNTDKPIREIPKHMWQPLWENLLIDAERPDATPALKVFVGMCYIEGDGVEKNCDEGLKWLLRAATEESSSKFLLAQAREYVLLEHKLAEKPLSAEISSEVKQEWILDSIFLLAGGFWHCSRDRTDHSAILKSARNSFDLALSSLDEFERERILDIGFNTYNLGRPTEHSSDIRERNARMLRLGPNVPTVVVLTRDHRSADQVLQNGDIQPEAFWDDRVVRAVAHYGYEDSIRLLHRLDITRQHTTWKVTGQVPESLLLRAVNNCDRLEATTHQEPKVLLPVLHEAVANHRLSCLTEILRLGSRPSCKTSKVRLDNTSIVEDKFGSETHLHMAVRMLRPYLVCLLLEHGADPNAKKAKSGETPLHIICRTKVQVGTGAVHWSKTSYLESAQTPKEQVEQDMEIAKKVVLELLLQHPRINLQLRDDSGYSASQLVREQRC